MFALFSKERNRWAILLTLMGTLVFAVFIAGFWIYLQRPPLRTMGETRLWYSFFMGISGLLTYIRWKYPWILSFSTVVGAVFALINILKPEIHDQSLMPALQSPWFIPHVTIYMFSYSVLGCAFILSCMGLFKHRSNYLEAADKLIYTGLAFLTVGMLTGAIWRRRPGDITGAGIRKKPGRQSPGPVICCMYTCVCSERLLRVCFTGS